MVDLQDLSQQVIKAAQRAAERSKRIPYETIWERLMGISNDQALETLQGLLPIGWYGAVPSWEPVNRIQLSNADALPMVGVDGSQIYPAVGNPVRWAYIQACGFRSGNQNKIRGRFIDLSLGRLVDSIDSESGLLFESSASTTLVDSLRTLLEADVAVLAARDYPDALILIDNPLMPYQDYSNHRNDWLERYISRMKDLEGQKVCGYVSSPQSRLITNLVDMVYPNLQIKAQFPFLDDSMLMTYGLPVGIRSAVFQHGSLRNQVMLRAGLGIFFFYIKINDNEVARVEIPQWVAKDDLLLDQIHTSILRDCRAFQYPYALRMAHERVTIPLEIVNDLHHLAFRTYLNNRGYYRISAKNQMKNRS